VDKTQGLGDESRAGLQITLLPGQVPVVIGHRVSGIVAEASRRVLAIGKFLNRFDDLFHLL